MGQRFKSTGRLGLLFALGLAALLIYRFFPTGFLAGTSSYWLTETDDVTQYISGFNAYFNGPFSFPLLAFNSINFPEGTRATFVDAIPLYAFLLKVFMPASFAPFNPLGAWVGFVFVMQAVCGWWILRELKVESWFALLAIVCLLLTLPALTTRLGHISLMSHWLVLAAIALYARDYSAQKVSTYFWVGLLFCAFYINIYLFSMASSIYVVSVIASGSQWSLRAALRWAAPFLVIAVSLLLTIFPMPASEVSREGGFGIYSLNLLSPFSGGRYLVFPNPEMPGQYEGFNYLGIGVILAFAMALWVNFKYKLKVFGRHHHCLILMVLFTVYALSDKIYLGVNLLVTLNYPGFMDGLTSQFRASGRFFWPVGYCVIVFSILMLYRKLNKIVFSALMVAVVLLQFADLKDLRHRFFETLNRPYTPVLNVAAWDSHIKPNTQSIYFYPKFRCGRSELILNTLMPVMRYAAWNKINLNTGYVARYQPDCSPTAMETEIQGAETSSSAFVFVKAEFSDTSAINKFFKAGRYPHCDEVDFAYICKFQ